MARAAIILAGGRSSRMGVEKASLPFGGTTMLGRVLGTVLAAVDRAVVVLAPSQTAPMVPAGVMLLRDRREAVGPLEGLAVGLAYLRDGFPQAPQALALACDTPLLTTAWIDALFEMAKGCAAVVPRVEGRWYPLHAVYATHTAAVAETLLGRGVFRLQDFIASLDAQVVDEAVLRKFDPQLRGLWGCNTPQEYAQALAAAEEGPISRSTSAANGWPDDPTSRNGLS